VAPSAREDGLVLPHDEPSRAPRACRLEVALLVPLQAVAEVGGSYAVYVPAAGGAERREVEIGRATAGRSRSRRGSRRARGSSSMPALGRRRRAPRSRATRGAAETLMRRGAIAFTQRSWETLGLSIRRGAAARIGGAPLRGRFAARRRSILLAGCARFGVTDPCDAASEEARTEELSYHDHHEHERRSPLGA